MIKYERFIRDPIHDYIPITRMERMIIDTKYIQRLRYIHQNGISYYVYPGLQHSRFEHSLGTMYIAGEMISALIEKRTYKDQKSTVLREWFLELVIRYPTFIKDEFKDIGKLNLFLKEKILSKDITDNILKIFKEAFNKKNYENEICKLESKLTCIFKNIKSSKNPVETILHLLRIIMEGEKREFWKNKTKLNGLIKREIIEKHTDLKKTINDNICNKIAKALFEFLELDFKIYNMLNEFWKKCLGEDIENKSKIIDILLETINYKRIQEYVRISALLHDIGHLPFSHTFEMLEKRLPVELDLVLNHEVTGKKIIRNYYASKFSNEKNGVKFEYEIKWELIILILNSVLIFDPLHVLRRIICSQVDADRADYLLRDQYMSGADFGKYDLKRLISNLLVFHEKKQEIKRRYFILAFDIKALSVATNMIIERYNLIRWLQYHHTVVIVNEMLAKLIEELIYLTYNKKEEENIVSLLEISPPLFWKEDKKDAVFLDEAYVISELRSRFENLKEMEILKNLSNIANFELLINSVLTRKNLPTSLWKYISEYWTIFIQSIIKGIKDFLEITGKNVKSVLENPNRTLNFDEKASLGFLLRGKYHKRIKEEKRNKIWQIINSNGLLLEEDRFKINSELQEINKLIIKLERYLEGLMENVDNVKIKDRDEAIHLVNRLFFDDDGYLNITSKGIKNIEKLSVNFIEEVSKEYKNNEFNFFVISKKMIPYVMDFTIEIKLIDYKATGYNLSDLSLLVNSLKNDYDLKVPKIYVYIQNNNRKIVVENIESIRSMFNKILSIFVCEEIIPKQMIFYELEEAFKFEL
ncbi:MAG: HD domain-containing protein [Candidatus Heimdallarchaeota archaeon]